MASGPLIVPPVVPKNGQLSNILYWVGFIDNAQRTSSMGDAFTAFNDILALKLLKITELSKHLLLLYCS